MGQLACESGQTGRDPVELSGDARYGRVFEEGISMVTITEVFIFPILSAMLGALAAFSGRSKVVMLAGLGLAALVLFHSTASGFSVRAIALSVSYLLLGCVFAWSIHHVRSPGRAR